LVCECSFLGPQASRLPRSFFALRAQCRRDACGPRKEHVHNLEAHRFFPIHCQTLIGVVSVAHGNHLRDLAFDRGVGPAKYSTPKEFANAFSVECGDTKNPGLKQPWARICERRWRSTKHRSNLRMPVAFNQTSLESANAVGVQPNTARICECRWRSTKHRSNWRMPLAFNQTPRFDLCKAAQKQVVRRLRRGL
jgi:hypothetical protein